MADEMKQEVQWERAVIEKALLAQYKELASQRRWRIFFRLFIFAVIIGVIFLGYKNGKPRPILKDHVALVDLEGVIGERNGILADEVATGLRHAFENDKAKAIMIRINSPGGSPVESSYIYDEIKRLRSKYTDKKVYAVITNIGASGGYFIAAAADEIYANPSSIVGSIGVVMMNLGFMEAAEKLGIEQRSLTAGKNKAFLDPLSPVDDEQKAFAQGLLDNVHKHFKQAVIDGRGDRLKQSDELFSGLIWTGDQALGLGLIDGLGSPGHVAREVIGIEEITDYTVATNFLDRIASRMGNAFGHSFATSLGLQQQATLQ